MILQSACDAWRHLAIIRLEAKETWQRGSGSHDYMELDKGEDIEGFVKRLWVGMNTNQ